MVRGSMYFDVEKVGHGPCVLDIPPDGQNFGKCRVEGAFSGVAVQYEQIVHVAAENQPFV
eukprot:328813-Pleurochrysis_carterae.AAC.1